jgi:hypothetical protein
MINGKAKFLWRCPYYDKWTGMLARCYDPRELEKYPTYVGCYVSEDFRRFSDFKIWVDKQPNRDWQTCHLDKDLLIKDNKCYSKNTCVFVSPALNLFITNSFESKTQYLIGAKYHKRDNIFESCCSNPLTYAEDGRYLGRYKTEMEAHLAWKTKKHEYACILADQQADERLANALRNLFKPD